MAVKRNNTSGRKGQDDAVAASSLGDRLRTTSTWIVLLFALGAIGYLLSRDASGSVSLPGLLPTIPPPNLGSTAQPAAGDAAVTPVAIAEAQRADAPADASKRIGIVSGHRGNDSGTLCSDGLTEASVNFDHATRAADILRAAGYDVDILDEKDARLKNYEALAFVSIHADSCTYINDLATGYKVSRSVHSAVPETEDRLVACLTSRYKRTTGMRFNRNTITRNMTEYHGFYKIGAKTPSAIIETGFMNLDRDILTKRADDVAKGIADGVLCFLRNETP
jgi:N-acetylmuramoyl-L-alanine amidase